MNKYDAAEIRALFDRGENIIGWIQSREGAQTNSETAILYSYDVQAGSYVAELADEARRQLKDDFGRALAGVLDELAPVSLLEAGTGEATSLAPVLCQMAMRPAHVLGFDLSLSRLLYARKHLADHGRPDVVLFTAALDRIPLASASVDVVLTVHAVEPNHGREDDYPRRAPTGRAAPSCHDRTELRACPAGAARAHGAPGLCPRPAGRCWNVSATRRAGSSRGDTTPIR